MRTYAALARHYTHGSYRERTRVDGPVAVPRKTPSLAGRQLYSPGSSTNSSRSGREPSRAGSWP